MGQILGRLKRQNGQQLGNLSLFQADTATFWHASSSGTLYHNPQRFNPDDAHHAGLLGQWVKEPQQHTALSVKASRTIFINMSGRRQCPDGSGI